MNTLLFAWWTWALAALVLAILEVLAPAFLLLGLAIGAAVVSLALLVIGPALFGGSIAITLSLIHI